MPRRTHTCCTRSIMYMRPLCPKLHIHFSASFLKDSFPEGFCLLHFCTSLLKLFLFKVFSSFTFLTSFSFFFALKRLLCFMSFVFAKYRTFLCFHFCTLPSTRVPARPHLVPVNRLERKLVCCLPLIFWSDSHPVLPYGMLYDASHTSCMRERYAYSSYKIPIRRISFRFLLLQTSISILQCVELTKIAQDLVQGPHTKNLEISRKFLFARAALHVARFSPVVN